ncbi:MAG: amino acid ABC transporter permease [Deltaproteobacteria bacterium]|jgi:L-cystine transport system permease protein|nr:amino acid ABC transporter permease [Deltaproteobacteria bacterium]
MNFSLGFALTAMVESLKGVPVTLFLIVATFGLALPISFSMALARVYKIFPLDPLIRLYVSFVRGTPMLAHLFFFYNLLPMVIRKAMFGLGLNGNLVYDLNPVWLALFVLLLNYLTFMSENFRAAILSIQKDQFEGAYAFGFTKAQAYRRIIIPQAMSTALPALSNSAIGILKSTSVVFVIGVRDVTANAKQVAATSYRYLEAYVDILIIYLVICFLITRIFQLAESRIRRR